MIDSASPKTLWKEIRGKQGRACTKLCTAVLDTGGNPSFKDISDDEVSRNHGRMVRFKNTVWVLVIKCSPDRVCVMKHPGET